MRQIRKVGVTTHDGVKVCPLTPVRFCSLSIKLCFSQIVPSLVYISLLLSVKESNRFRKCCKGVAEFTIIRTKGIIARAGDVSSEDEGSNDLQDLGGDSEQEANSDDLEPRAPGHSENEADSDKLELQESGDSDQEANCDELESPEQGNGEQQEL